MDGLTSARSRVEKILAFNRERNPTWHVFTCVMEAEALEAADAADLRCRRGSSLGPLDGITVAIKDNIDVRGQATSAGIRHYRNAIAAADAPLVRQLRAAGSVIVGKTNMHEAALGLTSDKPWFGRCENPRYPGHTPGGSSGGSAAAVASGLCSLTAGTDSMGSIRIPAACCGIAGFMPTRGAIEGGGITPLSGRLDTPGLLAASAAEIQRAWRALTGEAGAAAPQPRQWRVGLPAANAAVMPDPAMREMMANVATRLEQHGARAAPARLYNIDLARLRAACFVLCEIDAARVHAQALAADPAGFSAGLRSMLEYGARQAPERRLDILSLLDAARETLLQMFDEFDLLMLPATPHTAFLHGMPPPVDMADLTVPANVAGLPAVTIPWGEAPNGLPVSLQILAAPGSDTRLLAVAALMEQWQPG